MTSHEPRGRRVVDPKPVRPNYETRSKPVSDSGKAREEMNKPKSVLRRADFNLREVDYPPAGNTSTMSVQIDKVPKFYIDEQAVKEQVIVDKHGRTSHFRAKLSDGKRKIVRSEDRYREEDFELNGLKSRKRSPLREPNAMNPSDSNPLYSYSSVQTRAPFADDVSDIAERHRQKYKHSEYDDIFRREHYSKSSKDSSCDIDTSSAVCDANVKFLNDFSIVDSNGHSGPSQLTKVSVTVPSAPTSSSYSASLGVKEPGIRNGYSERDRNGNPDQMRKLVHGRRKLNDILRTVDPDDECLVRIRERIKKQRDAVNSQETSEEIGTKCQAPGLPVETGIRNGYSERDRNGNPDQVSSRLDPGRWTLKDILRTVDPNDEGLQRIRERIKKQKDAVNGQETGEELGTKFQVPELPQRTLHKPNEPVRGHRYDIYIDEPPPIPARKVATGCRVPSYRGFSETETLRESSSRHGRVPEGRRKTSKPYAQPQLQPATHPHPSKHHSQESRKNGDCKPEEGKKMTRVVAQKHPVKSEVITTHSWREGQKAIIKELGPQKMSKLCTLLPTTDDEIRKTEHCSKRAKKQSMKEQPSGNEHNQMALSAEAQSVLADLHDANSDDENAEDRGKSYRRSSRHKRSLTPEKDSSEKPQAKVRHYDSNEVRKYIAKQRAEKKRKQQEEEEKSRKREEARKKMLKEVFKKQKARARAAQPKSDNVQYRIDPPDAKHKAESDKENFSGDSSSSSTITEPSGERKTSFELKPAAAWQNQSVNTEILLRKFLGSSATDSSHSEFSKSSAAKPTLGQLDPDAHKKAGEIVKQITEKSGLSVDEIVSKYARQAEAIKSTFTQPDIFPRHDKISAPKHDLTEMLLKKPVQPTKGVAAKLDRIQAIKNTASSLQTRLQLEAQRLASAVPLVADKWNKPKDEPEFVSRYQQLIGQPVTGFDGDLPGVTNLDSFTKRLELEGAKTEAAIKIQAAFRGHNVRQSLAWRYREHKTLSSKHKLRKSHKDLHISELDALSDSTLTEDSLPEESQRKKLSTVPPYVPARGIKPSKPIPAWDQQTSDPYTFYSVYSRKNTIHKPRIPTPPLSDDDDEEMRELTEPPPPPPVLFVPLPSKIRKPRATSPSSLTSDTASSVEEDLHHSDKYEDDFTSSHISQRGKSSSERNHSGRHTGHRDNEGNNDEDDDDTLNRTLTESTSSETSRKAKDHLQSQSLVLSSKDKVDKESDWSDVSSLTDESYSAFPDMNGQAKPAYTKMNYRGNQWSPGVLHHRLAVELNYLEGSEELLQQVTNIERTLGIAAAQQETVSLAQVLKAHQQTHALDQADLQHKAEQESQQRAAQATRTGNLIGANSTGLNSFPREDHSTQYSLQERSQYTHTNSQYSGTEDQATSYSSQSYESSYTKSTKMPSEEQKKSTENGPSTSISSTSTIKTGTISTASDVSVDRKSTDSSIHTESGVRDDAEISKTESISEDIADYTADFDTEEELECSLREMLPSEGQRKQLKRQTSKDLSLFSDDSQFAGEDQVFSHRLSFEDDSFSRYNVDMVRKYLQDDETRERHHHAILKLREQALVEKTKAELAWLEQQKKQIKSKGADDAYPRLKQKERGIIRRLKQEQAELKRLQEVQRAASRQRLLMLKESQEIVKMQKSAQRLRKAVKACQLGKHEKVYKWLIRQPLVADDQVREKLKEPVMTDLSLTELMNEIPTDDDIDTGTESQPASPSKEKSDSEIAESFHKLKLMKLDTKFMTQREKKLQLRREVANLEKQKQKSNRRTSHSDRYEMKEGADTLQSTTPRTPRTESIQESIHTETTDKSRHSTIHEEISAGTPGERRSTYTSISEELSTSTPSTVKKSQYTSIQERLSAAPSSIRTKSCLNTAADSSLREETQNETEANISANIDYSNETFESEPVQSQNENHVSKTKDTSSSSPATTMAKPITYTENGLSVMTPHAASNNNIIAKNSESESEESFSVAASASETSDTSDLKARIRELSEELKRRKIEAERLKKRHEQKQKEKLRQKEEYLKKQIENYDNYISHVRTELNHGAETPERQGSPVRPQIKPRSHAVTKTTERPRSVDKGRHDLEPSSTTSAAPCELSKNSKAPEEKPSKPQEEEPEHDHLPSSPSKSLDITKSISEELIEEDDEVPSVEKSELKLDLQAKEEDKNQATTPRSIQESRLDTARSVTEIPEDLSVLTDRSEKSYHVSPRLEDIAESPCQPSSKHSEAVDENSEASEASHTDKSASYRTESYTSSDKSKSYSDDYSDESESSTTISSRTPRSTALSDKSAGQTSHVRSAAEPPKSVQTQDDISESLAEESQSDDESKSGVFFQLTETPQVNQAKAEPEVFIGDRVRVGEKVGTVQFVGFVKFAPGLHVGVALDEPEGTSDGTVEGVTYFKCEPSHGLMTSVDDVVRLEEEPKSVHDDVERSIGTKVTSDVVDDQGKDITVTEDASIQDHECAETHLEELPLENEEPSKSESIKESLTEVRASMEQKVEDKVLKEKECQKATDLAVRHMLDEAISQMMNIRNRKRVLLQEASKDMTGVQEQLQGEPAANDSEPTQNASEPVEKDAVASEKVTESTEKDTESTEKDSKLSEKDSESVQKVLEPVNVDADPIHRPVSPQHFRNNEFPDDDLYDFNNDVDDPWNDDDLGFGVRLKTSASQPGIADTDELKLDLSKLTETAEPEQVLYVVPHQEEEVCKLVSSVVDFFWERRRYGESWHDVEPPMSYYTTDESGSELDLHSKRFYKKLIFNLTAHVLRDMYEDEEEEVEQPPWVRQCLPKFKYSKRTIPPTTVDSLKPIVQRHIMQLLGLGADGEADRSQIRKWNTRKKKDRVDQILVQELREDEPQWVNYDDDELAVKMQLTDTLFESLVDDTVAALKPALANWSQKRS